MNGRMLVKEIYYIVGIFTIEKKHSPEEYIINMYTYPLYTIIVFPKKTISILNYINTYHLKVLLEKITYLQIH